MANIFAVAFSEISMHLAVGDKESGPFGGIQTVQSIPYPPGFQYTDFKNEHFVQSVSEILYKKKEELNTDKDFSLSFALPLNLAFYKRIAVPLETDKAMIREQAEWELRAYLPGELTDYKIIKTHIEFDYDLFKEILFVAIYRLIPEQFQAVARNLGVALNNVWLENVAVEKFLRANDLLDEKVNQFLVKIDGIKVKSILLISGQFYTACIDVVDQNARTDQLLKTIKQRYNQFLSLCEQLPFASGKELQLFYWGESIDDGLRKSLQKNFSFDLRELTLSAGQIQSAGIEAAGLVLG